MTAAMAGGADAALAGAAVLALTIAGAIAVRWVNGRLRSLRTQLLVIAGSGVVLGALTAWMLAALMLLDQAQLRPTLAVLGLTAVTGSLVVGNSPEEFAAQIKAEYEVYKKVVDQQKLKLD